MLLVLKPDGTLRKYVGARVLKEVTDLGLRVVSFAEVHANQSFLEEKHYSIHKGKFFFPWLVEYVSCSPVVVAVVEGEDSIRKVRDMLGPTLPEKAANEAPKSIRGRYGIAGGVNVAHASDSPSTASSEVEMWTNEFGLRHDGGGAFDCSNYVSKYIDYPSVDTIRYREICKGLTVGSENVVELEKKLTGQLNKETDEKGSKYTPSLSKVIVKNFLIREP